ncbi:uncharacterized protein BDV14DRAFT_199250 [Aspergillus stella-maris]|uniref:uncharacterized protein n=1 Tax=Aspergillus stella-maris TaxID=1810926 RepID=UPI003CCE3AB4
MHNYRGVFYKYAPVIRNRLAELRYGWHTEYDSPRWKLAVAYQDAFKWWLRDVNFYSMRDSNNGRNSLHEMPPAVLREALALLRDLDRKLITVYQGMLSYWNYEPEEQSRDVREDYLQEAGELMGRLVKLAKDIQEDASLLEVVPGDCFIAA